MLIVGQNKRAVVNLKKVVVIGKAERQIHAENKDYNIALGEYTTEKQASDVLMKICKCYEYFCQGENNAVYEMPADEGEEYNG